MTHDSSGQLRKDKQPQRTSYAESTRTKEEELPNMIIIPSKNIVRVGDTSRFIGGSLEWSAIMRMAQAPNEIMPAREITRAVLKAGAKVNSRQALSKYPRRVMDDLNDLQAGLVERVGKGPRTSYRLKARVTIIYESTE